MVIDDTGSEEGIYALYIEQSGHLDRCHGCLTDSQTLKDSATQLLIKNKSGALVTQFAVLDMMGVSLNIVLFTGPKIFENRREYLLPSGVTSNITLPFWNVTPKGPRIKRK